MRLILLGPPGAGKGTQARRLAKHFEVPRISVGDILRRQVAEKTNLGRQAESYIREGGLVPDDLVIEMVLHRLEAEDAQKGFVLDGFPRTKEQAAALDDAVTVDHALLLFLDPEDLIRRSTGRRLCENCEAVYHIHTNPPKAKDACDQCGGPLITRADDQEETVRRRIDVYESQTKPVASHYKDKGVLVQIYGSGLIDEVFERAIETLSTGKG